MKYQNIVDYVKTNFNTFEEEPFNKVDAMVLTWLSYINYPPACPELYNYTGVGVRDLLKAEYFDEMFTIPVQPEQTKELFLNLAFSPRFRNIAIANYTNYLDKETDTQFCAITIKINPALIFVAYRGTDATFIGWKEDFLLSIDAPIPSEILGQQYLSEVLTNLDGQIIVSGHSKGGTIAVYSAVMNQLAIQDRVVNIYSFDGPGFRKAQLATTSFKALRPKMIKVIPQASMIGSLFNHECDVDIIFSHESGFQQHDPYTWEVVKHDFIYKDEVTPQSKLVYQSFSELAECLSTEDKLIVINAVFDILQNSGATSFTGFTKVIIDNLPYFRDAIKNMDKETRQLIGAAINNLAAISFENIPETILKWNDDAET